ncbi:MAG: formate dehydrogenase [Gammaproteobacteria bacterium]|nr:formate dehydrogenase [Gammaproteobacteria bacterium]MDA8008755.1 formate dehydrogenase [Alphaproteobacteria bacterium]MDA8007731.1 formate dehydrogenase [Gammaproteobacteria bacterium]MDA8011883.1 formate dehydrogenase [Gammaproteobacteria bacterium]MDA8015426.1 formate dehydrogenase [Gammaproteobacteria bacterium]
MKSAHSSIRRRAFLQGAAGLAAGAGASRALAYAPDEEVPAKPAPQKRGYRETAHVREYYRLARF